MNYSVNVALVNGKTDNKPVNRSYSIQDFSKLLSTPIVAKQKDGNAFCACHFEKKTLSDKGGWKLQENVNEMTLLVIEYDHEGTIADVSDSPAWRDYQYFLYSTHSHLRVTEKNPQAEERFRLVFPLAVPIPASKYPEVIQWAIKKSENKIDPIKNLDRLWYFPRIENAKAPFCFYENEGELLDYRKLDLTPPKKPVIFPQRAVLPPRVETWNANEKYVQKAIENEKEILANTQTNRNQQLFKSTAALAQLVPTGVITENDIEAHLIEACGSNGLIADDGEKTVKKTIASGLKTGKKTPRVIPEKPQEKFIPKTIKPQPKSKVLIPDYDPRALAKDFLEGEHHYFIAERHYYFNGKAYQLEDVFSLRSRLSSFLDSYMVQKNKSLLIPIKKTRSLIADIISQIEAITYSELKIPDPLWKNFICVQNGVLNVNTLELRPHTPDFLTTNLLEFDYDSKALCPIWDGFLATQCPTGTQLLQEWFGLNLIPDMSYHKIFFLLGQPRTGKSTCLNVLKLLIGTKNFLASSFSSLQNDFGLQPFIGKLSAIFGDAHFSQNKHNDSIAVLERIKQISGGDSVSINRKRKEELTIDLQTRLTFAVNEIPRLNDKSNALLERLLIVKFENKIKPENRDTLLENKLKSEISGIFNWALAGLKRLKTLGFSLNQQNLVNDFALANNPLAEWIDDCCEHPSTGRVQQSLAYDSWKDWCVTNGKFCGSKNALTSALETTYGIEKTKSGSVRYYVGISLK